MFKMRRSLRLLVLGQSLLFSLHSMAKATDHAAIPEVKMNEYIFTSANQFSQIQTFGATTCIVLILYNKKTKFAAMGHFSANANVHGTVKRIVSEFKRAQNQTADIQAEMYGGWRNSSEQIALDIRNSLKKEKIQLIKDSSLKYVGPDLSDPLMLLPTGDQDIDSNINVQFDLRSGRADSYDEMIPSNFVSTHFSGLDPKSGIMYRHEFSLNIP